MNSFLQLPAENRRTVYNQVGMQMGISPLAVEKDVWVTSVLQTVFTLPYADKLVFKGGTSLSKIWKLIDRFSEDIDLAIDRSVFEMEGDLTKKNLKRLRKASSLFVRDTFTKDLQKAFELNGLADHCTTLAEPDGEGDSTYPEPRKVHVAYDSVFDGKGLNYLQREVMLELGARSLMEPSTRTKVLSLVNERADIDTSVENVDVVAVVPEKTFLEKAFLLHELFTTDGCNVAARKSRHLYDLERMMDEPFAQKAIRDDELWESIRHHREIFTSVREVDYTPDVRKRIVIVPPERVLNMWKDDYKTMRESMIYGESPSFEQVIAKLRRLQERFRAR